MNFPAFLICWWDHVHSEVPQYVRQRNSVPSCLLSPARNWPLSISLHDVPSRLPVQHGCLFSSEIGWWWSSCIWGGRVEEYRDMIRDFVDWCNINHFRLNTSETKEMVISFWKTKPALVPFTIRNTAVEVVSRWPGPTTWRRRTRRVIADCTSWGGSRLYYLQTTSAHLLPDCRSNCGVLGGRSWLYTQEQTEQTHEESEIHHRSRAVDSSAGGWGENDKKTKQDPVQWLSSTTRKCLGRAPPATDSSHLGVAMSEAGNPSCQLCIDFSTCRNNYEQLCILKCATFYKLHALCAITSGATDHALTVCHAYWLFFSVNL